MLRKPIILFSCVFLCLCSGPLAAQTDYSLRMRSLGTTLAGILDDELTDVFLNPARLHAVTKYEIHTVNLPSRSISIPFPVIRRLYSQSYRLLTPSESHYISFSYTPITLGFFASQGEKYRAAFGLEVYTSNLDDLHTSTYHEIIDYYSGDFLRMNDMEGLNRRDTTHLLFDVLLSRPLGDGSLGVRLRGVYDKNETNDIVASTETETSLDAQDNTSIRYWYNGNSLRFERSSFSITGGLFQPGGMLKDLAISFEGTRYNYPNVTSYLTFQDDDLDRNGIAIHGGNPSQSQNEAYYESSRDYLELGVSARAHLTLRGRLRSVHTVSWLRASGDGSARYGSEHIDERSSSYESLSDLLEYGYEGVFSRIYASTIVGRTDKIHDKILFAWGVGVAYLRKEFEENGKGDLSLEVVDEYFPDTLTYSSEYFKLHDNLEEYYYLLIPCALECKVTDFFSLRFGAQFNAVHHDKEGKYSQSLPAEAPAGQFSFTEDIMDYKIDYKTSYNFFNGLEINIKDKLTIDLYAGLSSRIDIDSYGHLSLRYRF